MSKKYDIDDNIVVSICCITYNHAPYIRECIEGFLKQKTNFQYEILIHDDASKDETQSIIKEYEALYPSIIKPIYQKENQYSKGKGYIGLQLIFQRVQGKYIALCEGDDYWTDPLKLQKQVDFLESHPDYALCFHNAMEHYEDGLTKDHPFATLENREYNRIELTENWLAPTASFTLRKDVVGCDLYYKVSASKKIVIGDYPVIMTASYCGKIYAMSEIMSVYRKHESGMMMQLEKMNYSMCVNSIEMKRLLGEDLNYCFKKTIASYFIIGINMIRHHQLKSGLKLAYIAFVHEPVQSIKALYFWYRKYKNFKKGE